VLEDAELLVPPLHDLVPRHPVLLEELHLVVERLQLLERDVHLRYLEVVDVADAARPLVDLDDRPCLEGVLLDERGVRRQDGEADVDEEGLDGEEVEVAVVLLREEPRLDAEPVELLLADEGAALLLEGRRGEVQAVLLAVNLDDLVLGLDGPTSPQTILAQPLY
jgi:hypothetical protein